MDSIKQKIKDAHFHKYGGLAPEGFTLIPNETLERLKDFDVWKEWKLNPETLYRMSIEDAKKLNK